MSQMPLPPSKPNEQKNETVDEFCQWYEEELRWWATLHDKDLHPQIVGTILEELLNSGYTLKQASDFCVHERLRRHRWELSITVFYPDDKLVTSELINAMQRSYRRGYVAARNATHEQEKHKISQDDAVYVRKIAELNARITELETELTKHRRESERVSKLSSM